MELPERALIVGSPWIDAILSGQKTWEIRGSRTTVRSSIGLIRKGSGQIVGTCRIVDVIGPLTLRELQRNARKAGLPQPSVHTRTPTHGSFGMPGV